MKNSVSTVVAAVERIQKSARHMPEVRVIPEIKVGEVVRQGDIYIERVSAIEAKGNPLKSRQLAPGTTKGSRHIVAETDTVLLWESKPSLDGRSAFQVGPAIEALGDVMVTHPEHAWLKILSGQGKVAKLYQVWFQADWARKTRAQD